MRKHTELPSEERPEGRAIRIGQIPLFLRSLFPLALVDAIIHLSSPQHATITNTRFLFHSFPAADVSARVKHSHTHRRPFSLFIRHRITWDGKGDARERKINANGGGQRWSFLIYCQVFHPAIIKIYVQSINLTIEKRAAFPAEIMRERRRQSKKP